MPGITPHVVLEFSPTTGPFETPVWVDISETWMDAASVSRGRQDELSHFSPGRLSVVLNNSDRRFDPLYTAGTYFGNLKPRRPIRLSAFLGPALQSPNGTWFVIWADTDGSLVTSQVQSGPASTIVLTDSGATKWAVTVENDGSLSTATTATSATTAPILQAPDGGKWLVGVATDGSLTTTSSASAPTGAAQYLFTGYVDGWPQEYDPPNLGIVRLTATDTVLPTREVPSVLEQEIKTDTPKAWYRLGETSGTEAADSYSTHHAAYVGGATFNRRNSLVVGDSDSAIEFDGVDDYIEIPASAAVSDQSFTITFLLKTTDAGDNGLGDRVILFIQAPTQPDQILVTIGDHSGGIGSNGAIYFSIGVGTASARVCHSTVDVNDDSVHHIACTYDGTTARVYVDGTDRTSTDNSGTPTPAAGYIWVGGGARTGPDALGGNELQYTGTLDELVIYDSTLSAARIAAHSEAALTPWDEDTPTARITSILNYIGFPSGDRDLDTGSAQLGPFEENPSTLDALHTVVDAESARSMLYPTGSGDIKFVGRQNFWTETVYTTSNATFGDDAGELRYTVQGGFRLDHDDYNIVNRARIAPVTGWFQQFSSTGSIDDHGPVIVEKRLAEKRATYAMHTAEWMVNERSEAVTRLDEITVNPEQDPTALYPVVLGADFGYRYTVKRRPQNVGSAISLEVHLEHAEHRLTPGSWETTWRLSQAESQRFIWGGTDATQGWGVGKWAM